MGSIEKDKKKTSWLRLGKRSQGLFGNDLIFLFDLRLRIFKSLVLLSVFFLTIVVFIQVLYLDAAPIADTGNVLLFIILYLIVREKPEKLHICSWLALFGFLLNLIDGFFPLEPGILKPAYILWPLLVLFGVLLGDIWISLTAFLFVAFAFVLVVVMNPSFTSNDVLIAVNLFLLTFASSLASWMIWKQYRTLIAIIKTQSDELKHELDIKMRLNAIIFHDLNSPLTMLSGMAQLMNLNQKCEPDDFEMLNKIAKRFSSIINSARSLDQGTDLGLIPCSVDALFPELNEMFLFAFELKGLDFVYENFTDEVLYIKAHREVLINSVLANFISNAIKFSRRDSKIIMKSEKKDNTVRISIMNKGQGFNVTIFESVKRGGIYKSELGTEGEEGSGNGLLIASICLQNMNAHLEIRNIEEGAEVAAVFPI
jgi:signal transduction histidine kinase